MSDPTDPTEPTAAAPSEPATEEAVKPLPIVIDPPGPGPAQVLHVRILSEQKAEPAKADVSVLHRSRRAAILFCLFGLTVAMGYFFFRIGDHPVRALALSIGALVTVVLGAAPALFRERPRSTGEWLVSAFEIIGGWAGRSWTATLSLCALILFLTFVAGHAGGDGVVERDVVECPPGVQLQYGRLGAVTRCEGDRDHIWAPFGLEAVIPTFRCVSTESGATWAPFRRAATVGGLGAAIDDPRFSDERLTCFENGTQVTPSRDCQGHALAYLEYGWGTDRLARELPAPCDDRPAGIYLHDVEARSCASVEVSRCPERCSPSQPPAPPPPPPTFCCPATPPPPREVRRPDSDCAELCGDALVDTAAYFATSTPAVREWLRGLGSPLDAPSAGALRFAHPLHNNQYKLNQLQLVLEARSLAFRVGVSSRVLDESRCVPAESRRDGFLHVFERDRETVLALYDDADGHRGFCLVETSHAVRPPRGVSEFCADPSTGE